MVALFTIDYYYTVIRPPYGGQYFHGCLTYRDAKTYERANNVRVKCFLSRVKFNPNFTLFCRKSELCRDFDFFRVIFLHIL